MKKIRILILFKEPLDLIIVQRQCNRIRLNRLTAPIIHQRHIDLDGHLVNLTEFLGLLVLPKFL